MASAFSHVVVPVVLYAVFKRDTISFRLFMLAAVLSILPDIDVIAFNLGIPYASPWGHRGFTHSIAFALILSIFFAFFKNKIIARPITIFIVCFIACVSHAVLDAMTNGGLGVAFFWPFSHERIFFPFRPIEVSPIGVSSFFSERGIKVILSEIKWVLAPGLTFAAICLLLKRNNNN